MSLCVMPSKVRRVGAGVRGVVEEAKHSLTEMILPSLKKFSDLRGSYKKFGHSPHRPGISIATILKITSFKKPMFCLTLP